MTNIEIKKAIQEATKRIEDFKIRLVIWYGDGSYHPELEKDEEIITNDLEVYNIDNEFDCIYSTTFGISSEQDITTKQLEILRKEQKTMYNYLKKHFNNISRDEATV